MAKAANKTGAGRLTEQLTILSSTPVAVAVTSITRAGAVATVTTAAAHGFVTGDFVTHAGAVQAEYVGEFQVTVTSPTVYTFAVSGTPATPATGTITTVYTSDSQGGMSSGPWTIGTVWAEVLPLSASEQLALGGIAAVVSYKIRLYYRADLKPSMKLRWTPYLHTTAKTLEIHGIHDDPNDLRRMLLLDAGEVV